MKKKTLAKKIKSFLKPSEPEEDSPGLAEALAKLTERMDALERKTDQILGRLSSLPAEIRNAVQPQLRASSAPVTQGPQRQSPAPQSQPFQRSSPSLPVKPLQPVSTAQSGVNPAVPSRVGRRDRLLFKAVCADCNQDCEVPIKPTEGRPVYCKPCFALRKAAKTLPAKMPDRVAAVGTMQTMPSRAPSPRPPVSPQAVASVPDAPPVRSSGHVPPQIHNMARRNAVAYLAKKAGHVPNPQSAMPQAANAAAVPAARVSAAKSSRTRPVRNDRAKPKKRSR